jgi:hypothetical protein
MAIYSMLCRIEIGISELLSVLITTIYTHTHTVFSVGYSLH